MRCQECGSDQLRVGDRFCSECGAVVRWTSEPQLASKIIDYRDLIKKSTEGFVGRQWVRDAVDDFLKADGPRSFLLLGEPGSGKTTIMADLVRRRGYPHHFIGKGSQIGLAASLDWRNPIRFAESIGYQLLRDYGGWIMDWGEWGIAVRQEVQNLQGLLVGAEVESFYALPRPAGRAILTVEQEIQQFEEAAHWVGVYIQNLQIDAEQVIRQLLTVPLTRLAQRWPEHKVVIVVDGLDEAEGYSSPERNILKLLPNGALPTNVRFLLSSRPGEHLTHAFLQQVQPFWVSEDKQGRQHPGAIEDAKKYALGLAREAQVKVLLEKKAIDADAFSERVAEASKGNFLYLYHYAQGVLSGDKTLLDLEVLPQGLYGIYGDFLAKIKEKRGDVGWDSGYKRVLGTLAVAREPLLRDQIARFSGVSESTVGSILTQVQQFLNESGPEEAKRYLVYHLSFSEYLVSERNADYISGKEAHRRIVTHYRQEATNWKDVNWHEADDYDYGLRHVAYHLLGAGQEFYDDLYKLINPSWRRIKLDNLKSDLSFLQDVGWALQAAQQEKTDKMPRYISLSLMAGSIATKSNDVIPEAIGAMVALRQEDRAQAYLQTISEPGVRAGALLQMARVYWRLRGPGRAGDCFQQALNLDDQATEIYTNPGPLINDLMHQRLTDEVVAVVDLCHSRMGIAWNSVLLDRERDVAIHVQQTCPGRIAEFRTRYPQTFGLLVNPDGILDETFEPPILLVNRVPIKPLDPSQMAVFQRCYAMLGQVTSQIEHKDLEMARHGLDEIEDWGRKSNWVLRNLGWNESDASEPWWPLLIMRGRAGPAQQYQELKTELRRRIAPLGEPGWVAHFAYSAALGELAIQLANEGRNAEAVEAIEEALSYCERTGTTEGTIDEWKICLADLLYNIGYIPVAQAVADTLITKRREPLAGPIGVTSQQHHKALQQRLRLWAMARSDDDSIRGAHELGPRLIQALQVGRKMDEAKGTRIGVAIGATIAAYLSEEGENSNTNRETRVAALRMSLRLVTAGEWEATRYLWAERVPGLLFIGIGMYYLAQYDRDWAESFLEDFFDIARRNGRHACWVHLVAATPTLELLWPGILPAIWNLLCPIERWHQRWRHGVER